MPCAGFCEPATHSVLGSPGQPQRHLRHEPIGDQGRRKTYDAVVRNGPTPSTKLRVVRYEPMQHTIAVQMRRKVERVKPPADHDGYFHLCIIVRRSLKTARQTIDQLPPGLPSNHGDHLTGAICIRETTRSDKGMCAICNCSGGASMA